MGRWENVGATLAVARNGCRCCVADQQLIENRNAVVVSFDQQRVRTKNHIMKISFHGAARTVTGSKHLLTLKNGRNILLDCGMFQGMGSETDELNRDWGFDPATVNYLILSHAHIDHCGLIPKLIKDGYGGKVFCTPGTLELASVLMEDSAGIQESDAKFENKRRSLKGLPYIKPLYTTEDALAAVDHFVPVEYNTWFRIEEGIEV